MLCCINFFVDGGEGFVGTVCEIGKSGSVGSPDKTVVVQWDNGTRTNYRVGYLGKYDLRVIDNAQIGKLIKTAIIDQIKNQITSPTFQEVAVILHE